MSFAAMSGEQYHPQIYFAPVGSLSCSWDSKNLRAELQKLWFLGGKAMTVVHRGINATRSKILIQGPLCRQRQSVDYQVPH